MLSRYSVKITPLFSVYLYYSIHLSAIIASDEKNSIKRILIVINRLKPTAYSFFKGFFFFVRILKVDGDHVQRRLHKIHDSPGRVRRLLLIGHPNELQAMHAQGFQEYVGRDGNGVLKQHTYTYVKKNQSAGFQYTEIDEIAKKLPLRIFFFEIVSMKKSNRGAGISFTPIHRHSSGSYPHLFALET